MPMHVAALQPADLPRYRALMLHAYDAAADAFTSTAAERAVEFSAKPKTRHKALIVGMFVHASARRSGAGRALLQAALDAARARPGLRVVTLTVTEGNAAALALYQAVGFCAFGVEPMAIATPDGFKGKVHMVLQLPGPPPGGALP